MSDKNDPFIRQKDSKNQPREGGHLTTAVERIDTETRFPDPKSVKEALAAIQPKTAVASDQTLPSVNMQAPGADQLALLGQDSPKSKDESLPPREAFRESDRKLTEEQRKAAAKDLASLFTSEGFTPKVKQKTLNLLQQVGRDAGTTRAPFSEKAMNDFINTVADDMRDMKGEDGKPVGKNLVHKEKADPDFMKKVDKFLEKHPNAEVLFSGKLEIRTMKEGKEVVESFMNFAQPVVRRTPPKPVTA